jgi:hypothetical protein
MAFPTPTTACVDDHSEIARADELVVGDRQLDDTGNLGRHRHHIGAYRPSMPGRYRKPQADAAWAAQQRFLSEIFGGGFGLGVGLLLHRLVVVRSNAQLIPLMSRWVNSGRMSILKLV